MSKPFLWLSILVSLIHFGHCYLSLVNGRNTTPEQVIAQTSCDVDKIDIGYTDDTLQCFPEPTMDKPSMAENGTICLLPRTVPMENELVVDETIALQCVNGWWTDGDLGKKKTVVKRGCIELLNRLYVGDIVLELFFKGISRRVVKKTPPTFKNKPCKPPGLQDTYYLDSGQDSVVVTWKTPKAQDKDGKVKKVVRVAGKRGGSRFEGGRGRGKKHTIKYKATDNDGLSATCCFSFKVIIRYCATAPWPNNGRRSCSHDNHFGSICDYNCNDGYKVSGNSQITCQGDWPPTPTCRKVACQKPPSLDNGDVSCSSPNYEFGSTCGFSCKTHYKLNSSVTYIQCRADKTWTPSKRPTCFDAVPPTLTTNTPQTFYADRGSVSTSVQWQIPTAVDRIDPNPIVIQTEGQTYGSLFQVGSSAVKYIARDSRGNKSPESVIKIIVKETECQHPMVILNDTYMDFNCKSYTFGTECTLACKFDIPLVGTDRITCERNSSDLSTGYWSWGDGIMPFCDKTDCPTPDPPVNGALGVGYLGVSKVITMSCQEQFDIPPIANAFTGQFVCLNNGSYSPYIDVPDCSEKRNPRFSRLPVQLYYSGSCEDATTKASIATLIQALLETSVNPLIQRLCPDVNNCTIRDLVIICGKTTARRRRDEPLEVSIREKRQVSGTLSVKFNIIAFIDQNLNSVAAIETVDALFSSIVVPRLNELVADGSFDIDGFTRESNSLDAPDYGDLGCDGGSVLAQTSCLACPPAYFHNTTNDQCELCPIAYYSDESALTSCKPCPSGYTTLKKGSKRESHCLEQCPAGRYSTTGTVPCTSCPIGSYQSGTGQTSCVKCTTGTTASTGSMSSTACHEFQLLVDGGNGIVTTQPILADMADATLAFWVKPSNSEMADVTIRLTSEGNDRISVYITDAIRVEVPETHFSRIIGNLTRDSWLHVAIEVDNTNNNVITYTNGQMHSSESFGTNLPQPFVSMGTLEIQTSANGGMNIADLHLENTVLTSAELSSLTSSCWTERPNAVFSMDDFRDTRLQNGHIQTPLSCDPIDECASNPCNNFTCVNGINIYTCYCSGGWSGTSCETPPDFCVDHFCSNGATCVNGNTGYTCLCSPGYSGDLCITKQVDGGWSDYTEWTECSATCDGGTQSRTRTCDNPAPSNNGTNCTGNAMETRACNTEICLQCPAFPRVYGGLPNCTEDGVTGLMSCLHQCLPGYVLPSEFANEVYTCGFTTNNEWMPMANVPPCQRAVAPSSYTVISVISYDQNIQVTDEASVKEAVSDNLSDVPCLRSNTCSASLELMESKQTDEVSVKEAVSDNLSDVPCLRSNTCSASLELMKSKRKRSTGSTITLSLSVDITETGDLDIEGYVENGTVSSSLQELVDTINSLATSASYINTSSSSIFDVTVNGVTYSSSQSPLTLSGTVTCPDGQTATEGVCASCPEGTYFVDGHCSFCERGAYSSSAGQTSCTLCPYGYTTASIGSTSISQCNVNKATTTETLTAAPTESPDRSTTDNKAMYIGIAVGVVLMLLFGIGFVVYRKTILRSGYNIRPATPADRPPPYIADVESSMEMEHTGNMAFDMGYPGIEKGCYIEKSEDGPSCSPPPPYKE